MPQGNDTSNKVLIPKDDLKEGEFPNTYLNIVSSSHDNNKANYEDLKNTKISQTTLPNLFPLFQSWAIPETNGLINMGDQEELHSWYSKLNRIMLRKYFPILEKLYRYNESIHTLYGYKNTKEYLNCALVRNKFLLLRFFNIMTEAASTLENEMTAIRIIRLMELEHPSDQEKLTIFKFLTSVMEDSHNKELYCDMANYGVTTSDLLIQVEKILKRNLQQMIKTLSDIDK